VERFRGVEAYCQDVLQNKLSFDLEESFENDIDDEFNGLTI